MARAAYPDSTTGCSTIISLSIEDTRDVIDALGRRFPGIQGPQLDDICYATQNRHNAVRMMAEEIDILLVVGARNSSNSNRLREVGEQVGVPSHLIESATEVDPSWVTGKSRIGITAGASAPEYVVQDVARRLRELGVISVVEMAGLREATTFSLPAVEPLD